MVKENTKQSNNRIDKQASSSRLRSTSLDTNGTSHFDSSQTFVAAARDKALDLATSARDWLKPDWTSPMMHFDSLSTVMFSPLAGHPVYRSESMVKAIQLAQQQQRQQATAATSPTSPKSRSDRNSTASSDLVLRRDPSSYPWPSSSVLLKADIPEPTSSLSLFQGFATTYPSLATSASHHHKKSKHRRKKQPVPLDEKELADKPGSLKRFYVEREKRIREGDNLEMKMISTENEIRQIDMQIDELISKRKNLETKWTKLEGKGQQVQSKIEDLTEKILDEAQDHGSVDGATRRSRLYHSEDEYDEEYEYGECFKSLHGHDGGILCIDFDQSNGNLVSSSLDDTLRVWDLRHGQCIGQLEGHINLVRCLQLDDMRLLTGSDDGTIKQWDLSCFSSAPTPASTDGFSDISSIQRSSSSSPDIHDNTTSTRNISYMSSFDEHKREVSTIDADLTNMVSGSNDKTMKLWDLETQNCVLTMDVMWASQHSDDNSSSSSWSFDYLKTNFFEPTIDYVGALQFWNSALASGTIDGKLRMWDLRTGQVHRTLPGHKGAITALQFDDIHLVSGSVDKTIRVWDLRTGSVTDTLSFSGPVSSLQFTSDKIISSTNTNDIDVYNRTSFQHTKLSGHTDSVNTLQYKNNTLASGGKDKIVKIWAM